MKWKYKIFLIFTCSDCGRSWMIDVMVDHTGNAEGFSTAVSRYCGTCKKQSVKLSQLSLSETGKFRTNLSTQLDQLPPETAPTDEA